MTATPTRLFSLVATLALVAASGCVVNNPPPPPAPGSITFSWLFEGERDCDAAGVAELDVQVLDASGVVFNDTVECFGDALTLTDFDPAAYEILLDAYSRSGRLLYQGDGFVQVQPGVENDIGDIELFRVGGQAAAAGSLSFFWGFLYPTDDSLVIACPVAGAEVISVDMQALSGSTSFREVFPCEDEGVLLENLPEGRYSVLLEAFGTYQNDDILLYDGHFEVDVRGNQVTDLGDLPLTRVFESFSDIEITWDLAGGTCAQLAIPEVTLVITRMDGNIEDDVVTVPCDVTFALRETFIPGSYFIEVLGSGAGGNYYGSVTKNVAPNTTAESLVQLVLTP